MPRSLQIQARYARREGLKPKLPEGSRYGMATYSPMMASRDIK